MRVEADRQLPTGNEIFLDHVGAFVPDAARAGAALARLGFTPTPASVQVNPDPAGGPPQPTGTGNVCAMLERGYLELLFKTAQTPLGQEFDAALARYPGMHLAAFAIADAQASHHRLAQAGFAMQPVVDMRRPVDTEAGPDVARFNVVRLAPGQMAEGRIQMLRHLTEDTVWQPRWLTHPNTAMALLGLTIAVADVDEAARRYARFLGRAPMPADGGARFLLDRGQIDLVPPSLIAGGVPALPFMACMRLRVRSLAAAAAALHAGSVDHTSAAGCLTVPLPVDIGTGTWQFEA